MLNTAQLNSWNTTSRNTAELNQFAEVESKVKTGVGQRDD